ncbi:2476_t:CDS:2, partial [Paraglomus occultum]
AIAEATRSKLQKLPDTPINISDEIKAILPFELPIKFKSQTRAVVTALHKVFEFEKLPPTYFIELPPLPHDINDLDYSIKHLFPITERRELGKLAYYRKRLQEVYSCDKIPDHFFNLPPPMPEKPALPPAYQDIENPQLRACFPIDRANQDTNMQDIVTRLREYYAFQNIPNDYFLVKPSLPKDPSRIKTQNTYTYPITDDTEAATFIHEELIMTANPTNKPRLPTDPKMITEVNLTIPIDTPKRITETACLLRPHYYFQKLPTEWIQILETNNKTIDEMSANKE